jgi:N12 class adenine-specific DNA methylase
VPKSLFVVPNHLIGAVGVEYLQLYPSANILVATKKDFETKNRKKFCGRIATGDYDAIIIGHSQFEKIPMSLERQRAILSSRSKKS